MVAIVGEHGYAAASVDALVKRAKVSRRTFYELFDSVEDCFAAVLTEGLERSREIMAEAFRREARWEDGVTAALAGLLVYFDSEPTLARVWLIESLAAASWAVERRERYVAQLRALVIGYWRAPSSRQAGNPPLRIPEPDSPPVVGAMAAVLGVIHTHLLRREREPLITLLAPLVEIVMSGSRPPAQVADQVGLAEELSRKLLSGPYPPAHRPAHPTLSSRLPEGLRDPRAHRARGCLLFLLAHPGASNRQIATGIGMASHAQVSSLLGRLSAMGMLIKGERGAGLANAWWLSELGTQTAHAIEDSSTLDCGGG